MNIKKDIFFETPLFLLIYEETTLYYNRDQLGQNG